MHKRLDETGLFDVPPTRVDDVSGNQAPWTGNSSTTTTTTAVNAEGKFEEKFVYVAESKPSEIRVRKRYSQKLARQLQAIGVNVDIESGMERETLSSEEGSLANGLLNHVISTPDGNSTPVNRDQLFESIADETLAALSSGSPDIMEPDNPGSVEPSNPGTVEPSNPGSVEANDDDDTESVESFSTWDPMKASFENKTFNSYHKQDYDSYHNFKEKHAPIRGPDGKSKISPTKLSSENMRLYIKNIPMSLTEEGLANMFSTVGKCLNVKKVHKRGEDYTIGFVSYKSVKEAEAAICKYNNFDFGNEMKLHVRLARETGMSHPEIHWANEAREGERVQEFWDTSHNNNNDESSGSSPAYRERQPVGVLEYTDARCNINKTTENASSVENGAQGSTRREPTKTLWGDLKKKENERVADEKEPIIVPDKREGILKKPVTEKEGAEKRSYVPLTTMKELETRRNSLMNEKETHVIPKAAETQIEKPVEKPVAAKGNEVCIEKPVEKPVAAKGNEVCAEKPVEKPIAAKGNEVCAEKPAEKPVVAKGNELCVEKPVEKLGIAKGNEVCAEKPAEKPIVAKVNEVCAEKPVERPVVAKGNEVQVEEHVVTKVRDLAKPRLYVQGINVSTTRLEFRELFEKVAPVCYEAIIGAMKRDQYTTYGFISFETMEDAQNAIDRFTGFVFKGNTLNVEFTDDTKRLYGMMADDEDEKAYYDKLYGDEIILGSSPPNESTTTTPVMTEPEVVPRKLPEKKSMSPSCAAANACLTEARMPRVSLASSVNGHTQESRSQESRSQESRAKSIMSKIFGSASINDPSVLVASTNDPSVQAASTNDASVQVQECKTLPPNEIKIQEKDGITKCGQICAASLPPGGPGTSSDILEQLQLLTNAVELLSKEKEKDEMPDKRYQRREVEEMVAGAWDDSLGDITTWMSVIVKGYVKEGGEVSMTKEQINERIDVIMASTRMYQSVQNKEQDVQIEKTVNELKRLSTSNNALTDGLDEFKSKMADNMKSLRNTVEQQKTCQECQNMKKDCEEAYLKAYMLGFNHGNSQDNSRGDCSDDTIKESLRRFMMSNGDNGGFAGNTDKERYQNIFPNSQGKYK